MSEQEAELMSKQLASEIVERDKLAAFKAYVHARLDAAGVTADPESPHKAEGCRIGGRLDEVIGERDELRAENQRMQESRANLLRQIQALQRQNVAFEAECDPLRNRVHQVEVENERLRALLTAPLWLVWSNYHRAWWGPNRSQYYWDITAAGRYTFEEALKICASRGVHRGNGNPPELVQPSPEWYAARAAAIATSQLTPTTEAQG